MKGRSQAGTFAYFFAEPEEREPSFFRGLPPEGFSGARLKSPHMSQARQRMTVQLQVVLALLSVGTLCLTCMGNEGGEGVQALADIFSDHETFIVGELQPFFETSSSLSKAPSWGIVDTAFLRHLMASIQRPVLLSLLCPAA